VKREWGIGVEKRTSEEGGGDCLVLGVKLERVLSEEVGDDEAKVKKLMVVWLVVSFAFRFYGETGNLVALSFFNPWMEATAERENERTKEVGGCWIGEATYYTSLVTPPAKL
jgi:hypothetical protein